MQCDAAFFSLMLCHNVEIPMECNLCHNVYFCEPVSGLYCLMFDICATIFKLTDIGSDTVTFVHKPFFQKL